MKKIYMLLLIMSAMFFVSCSQDAFIKSVKVPVSGGTTGGTSGGTGGTTGGGITLVDSLINLVAPTTVSKTGQVTVSFDYSTKENRYVYIAIKDTASWTEFASTKLTDVNGSGNKSVNLTFSTVPTAGTNYKVIVTMIEASDNWSVIKDTDGNSIESSLDISITD